jgi:hypothetical protein
MFYFKHWFMLQYNTVRGGGFTLENVYLTLCHINFIYSGFVSLSLSLYTAHQAKSHKPETNKEKFVWTCEWTPASSRTVVVTCSNTVEMHFVLITMKKSINNKLFLADGQGDRQTDMTKLIVSVVILRTLLKIEFSFKLSTCLPSSTPATTRGLWKLLEKLYWKRTRICPISVRFGAGFVWCWNFNFGKYIRSTWNVLKRGTGGCMRSFGLIVLKIEKYYLKSRKEVTSYLR